MALSGIAVGFAKVAHPQLFGELFDDMPGEHAVGDQGHVAEFQKGQESEAQGAGQAEHHGFGKRKTFVFQQGGHDATFTMGEVLVIKIGNQGHVRGSP
jgi:hypothetical protein